MIERSRETTGGREGGGGGGELPGKADGGARRLVQGCKF